MLRNAGAALLVCGLAACGSTNDDGSVASGPLGQPPLMTAAVQRATQAGIEACADALTTGTPLSRLAARGFAPWRGGYQLKIDNPLIFAGDSSVSVRLDRRNSCYVRTGPAYPIELQTLQSITASALSGRRQGLDVVFMRSSDNFEIVLK